MYDFGVRVMMVRLQDKLRATDPCCPPGSPGCDPWSRSRGIPRIGWVCWRESLWIPRDDAARSARVASSPRAPSCPLQERQAGYQGCAGWKSIRRIGCGGLPRNWQISASWLDIFPVALVKLLFEFTSLSLRSFMSFSATLYCISRHSLSWYSETIDDLIFGGFHRSQLPRNY